METDALVRDYLGRLEAAAWPLPPNRRSELTGEVRQHIEMALTEAGRRDEVTVRNILERLGPPDEIVAAEGGLVLPTVASAMSRSPWGAVEIIAILLLTIGAFVLPFIGPIIGIAFVWASTQWTNRQKLIATAIVFALAIVPILGLFAARAMV